MVCWWERTCAGLWNSRLEADDVADNKTVPLRFYSSIDTFFFWIDACGKNVCCLFRFPLVIRDLLLGVARSIASQPVSLSLFFLPFAVLVMTLYDPKDAWRTTQDLKSPGPSYDHFRGLNLSVGRPIGHRTEAITYPTTI